MSTYKSTHTGERVDNAVTKIPEGLPTEDSLIVVKANGSASGYVPQSQIAYTNKENTFTEPQTFDYTYTTSSGSRHEYAEIGGDGAHYYHTQEKTDGTSTSGEAFISSVVGRISVNRSTNNNSGTSESSLTLDVNKNWIARNELTRERIDGNLGTPVQTYYAYKFPKTYPNKEVTLATIEDLNAAITDLDKGHIAYLNKENTFTERQRIVTPYDSDINTQEEGFIDAGIINVSRIKYTDDTKQYYTDNDAALNARYLQLKQQIKNESGLTQHIIQLDHDGIKQVDYGNNSNTNYGYIFPKTYPNQNVTLATIEDLTAQLDSILYPVQRNTQYSTTLLTAKNSGKYYTFTTDVTTTSDSWVDPDNTTVTAGTVVKILPIEYNRRLTTEIKYFFKVVGIDNRELYLTNGQGKCSIVKCAYGSDTTPKAIGNYSNVFSVDTDSQFGGQATSKYSTLFGVNVRADRNAEGSIVGGRYCIIDSPYTFAYGRNITTQANQETLSKVTLGYNNKFNTKAILEVGNGTDSIKSNAFEILKDGRAKVQTAPVDTDDVVRKLELDTKLDKAGGTISGSLIIAENLTVQGKTTSVDTQNLKVADKLIYVAKDNTIALTSPAGLITPKYDGTNNGGIVYDHTGTAYVGDISLDSNGNVDVNNSDLQPIATRNATITNGNLVKWDGTNHKLIDAGKNVDSFVDKLAASLRSQAYVRNANGEDSGLPYTYTDEGNTLALRNASGQLQVSSPSQDKDAANKSYADNLNARYVSTSILGG